MQRVTLTRTFRGIDNDGKAIFDFLVYGEKDNGDVVETTLKDENLAIIKDLEKFVETFLTKEDEFEILKNTVEFMNVSMIGSNDATDVDLPSSGGADLPPIGDILPPSGNGELPSLDGIELPPDIELPIDSEIPTESTENPTDTTNMEGAE